MGRRSVICVIRLTRSTELWNWDYYRNENVLLVTNRSILLKKNEEDCNFAYLLVLRRIVW